MKAIPVLLAPTSAALASSADRFMVSALFSFFLYLTHRRTVIRTVILEKRKVHQG